MQSFNEPLVHKGVVIGAAEGNIGREICRYLNKKGHDVVELSSFDDWSVDNNLFIFCNGHTELEWIGNQYIENISTQMYSNLESTIQRINKIVANNPIKSEWKRIIIIGSMAHNNVLNGSSAYCAAKAGINQYAKCAAYELAKKGWLVTVINPGNVLDTPMTSKVKEQLQDLHELSGAEAEAYWQKVNNLGEFITKKDIAKIVKFLLKPEARFLSGSSLDLRGSNR